VYRKLGHDRNVDEMETREIIIGYNSKYSPQELVSKILIKFTDILIKDTCYGCLVQGDKKIIEEIVLYVRELDQNNIFTRKRGFYLGDPRICRRLRLGGQRLGFNFLEYEYKILNFISKALESLETEEGKELELDYKLKKKEKISIESLKNVIEDTN
jgi:putative methanogenesis marker protein 6